MFPYKSNSPQYLDYIAATLSRKQIEDDPTLCLLLENELIKKLKPKYNILLKDDKTFPHLMIDVTSDFPSLKKYRGRRKDKNKC